jgi:hypothetical protein
LQKEYNDALKAAREAGEEKPWITAAKQIESRLEESYDRQVAAKLFALFKEKGAWQCPTLTVGRSIGYMNDPEFIRDPQLAYISPGIRRSWNPKNDFRFRDATDEDFADRRQRAEKELQMVRSMNQAGVPLLAGTDTLNPYCFPGFSLHDELDRPISEGSRSAPRLDWSCHSWGDLSLHGNAPLLHSRSRPLGPPIRGCLLHGYGSVQSFQGRSSRFGILLFEGLCDGAHRQRRFGADTRPAQL